MDKFTNKQTEFIYDFIENNKEIYGDVVGIMGKHQWQASFNAGNDLREYVKRKLTNDVRRNYSVITDFVIHMLTPVDWESLAKHYLEEYHGK